MHCPFISSCNPKGKASTPKESQIASLTKQLDREELDVLEEYKQEAGDVVIFMLPYILPTDQRLLLFEWLFDKCEPGIFLSSDFISSESAKVSNLELACRQYGIRQQGKRPLADSIKGTNGITEAINFLWEVTDFTRHLILFENLENQQTNVGNNIKLVNFISTNSQKVFTENVRLFSPGFPRLDEVDYESQPKLEKTHDELTAHLERSKQELDELKSHFDMSLTENASDSEFGQLEAILKQCRDSVIVFKQECESGLRTKLTKIQENSLSGVESLIESVYSLRTNVGKVSDDVGEIFSTANELQI
eukprot:CAMPEP_0168318038 /NCGR_PEP_ID=MMETSP0213-20121227/240_1 /TAXON_ID=151035 /ORGANISM="Euplotes harpa, Strain FSP1.4" /LENGTH=305 /DNA_ID=CAMNT_0008319027 /DNA_START=163 /DNA_END=1080 /DNA_ORIENTATION=-